MNRFCSYLPTLEEYYYFVIFTLTMDIPEPHLINTINVFNTIFFLFDTCPKENIGREKPDDLGLI